MLAAFLARGGWSRSRLLWFFGAEFLLASTVSSPLDVLAREYLFTAEAVERVVIGMAVPYLFILSMPPALSFGMNRGVNRYVAWIAGIGSLLIWFLPGPLKAAVASETVRGVEYATLIAGGVIFWWPIHAPDSARRLPMVPTSLIYLTAATIWCSIAGLFLAFEQPSLFSFYSASKDTLHIANSLLIDWSFSRENDQQTGGLLFWIGSATVLLSEIMAIYFRWYRSAEVREEFKGR